MQKVWLVCLPPHFVVGWMDRWRLHYGVIAVSLLDNAIMKAEVSVRMIHLCFQFYFMLRDKWFVTTFFPPKTEICCEIHTYGSQTYLTAGQSCRLCRESDEADAWCITLVLLLYISDLAPQRPQLNSALPLDFTDIFQGLAFKPCLD